MTSAPTPDGAQISPPSPRSAPLVSVGIPTYNRPSGLARTLECITRQTYTNLEILVSDNCSPDPRVREVVDRFCGRDPRVKYFRQTTNIGPSLNFAYVLHAATAEYFMWAADDDHWEPGFVSALVNLLETRPECVVAFCNFDAIDTLGQTIDSYPDFLPLMQEYSGKSLAVRLRRYLAQEESHGKANLIYGLYRRAALLDGGGVKAWGLGTWGADMLIAFRMLAMGDLALCPDRLFHVGVGDRAASVRSVRDGEQDGSWLLNHCGQVLRIAKALSLNVGYFSGYVRILFVAEGLSIRERLSLVLLVLARLLASTTKRLGLR